MRYMKKIKTGYEVLASFVGGLRVLVASEIPSWSIFGVDATENRIPWHRLCRDHRVICEAHPRVSTRMNTSGMNENGNCQNY